MFSPILPYLQPGFGPLSPADPARFQMFGQPPAGWIPATPMFAASQVPSAMDRRFMAPTVFNSFPTRAAASTQDRRNYLSHASGTSTSPVEPPGRSFDRAAPDSGNPNV